MRRILLTAAVLGAAAVAVWVALLPPGARAIAGAAPAPGVWRGAFHIHSRQSDGSGDLHAIATAAARAGLDFVIVTDHGDGTGPPVPPRYVAGVLCLTGVEISTDRGHYIALGMQASPYRLGGAPAAVVEDVRRLGGFGVVAHPDSPKRELAWPDRHLRVDGIEWLNGDSAWRDESGPRLAIAALQSLAKPKATLTALLDRPAAALADWDAATATAPVVGLAGADAHGGAGRAPGAEEGRGAWQVGALSYEASFRAFSTGVIVGRRARWDADADAAALLQAIRAGHVFSGVDGVAGPATLTFTASRDGETVSMGESLPGGGAVTFEARAALPDAGVLVLLRAGQEVARATGPVLTATIEGDGPYRVEGRLSGDETGVPWLVGNPIYVGLPPEEPVRPPPAVVDVIRIPADSWHVEHDPGSSATVRDPDGKSVRFEYALRDGEPASQYAAAAADLDGNVNYDAVAFTVAAPAAMRLSVQFRGRGDSAADRRWTTSVYAGPRDRALVLPISMFEPVRGNPVGRPEPGEVAALLFVVDLVNSRPGATGSVTLRDVRLVRIADTR